jgi:crotonobetainyl-CoA:carnitine CoA-transferase CaiB-like acyl-CoA transferase
MQPPPHPNHVLAALWQAAGHDASALESVELTGEEPALPSSFAVGTVAQATIAASTLAAAELWRLRTGRRQRVSVAMRDAAIEFRSERYLRVDGNPAPEIWDKIAGLYRCGDGRWVRLHTNFPHHRDGLLALIGCDYERAAVQQALSGWRAEALETAAGEAGLVATACRSFAEWDQHAQARAIAPLPLFSIDRIGEAEPEPLPGGDRPLAGIRVLDLTRVIAGPVCGRTLAAHGADVLLVTASHLPATEAFVIDSGRGKLSTSIDLRDASGRETLGALLRGADVFVQGYRPGAIAARGFGAQDAARMRPGIVYVSLCAYGHEGRGLPGAASIRWCRPQADSTMPRPGRPVPPSPSLCRARRSIMPPAT